MDKIKRLWPLAVGAIVLLVLFEWRPWHAFSGSEKTPPVTEAVVSEGPLLEIAKQDIRAQLSAVTYNSVSSELSARIQELPFKEGQAFKVGQVLVVFDCATQQAQFQKTKAVLSIAKRNYDANKKLLALGSVGRIEYENSYSEYLKTKAENDELATVLARCNILAPYSGLIVEQKVRAQQYVQAGQPLLDILDKSSMELEFVAPSIWSPWLTEGYKFEIKLDETGKSYPAKITRVNAKIDPVSQTIKVAAVIDGEFKEISPGMSGVLTIAPPEETSK
jgi:membrane fusion protein (multidrug efflux system)